MRVALITTPPGVRSGIGDYTRRLLPYLRRHVAVDLFTADELAGTYAEECYRGVGELDPRHYDRLLYQLGNEIQHAFMVPVLERLGGVVVLHDWVLFDLTVARFPVLQRHGWTGLKTAHREGGVRDAAVWVHNRVRCWVQTHTPVRPPLENGLPGWVLAGWHAPEPGGRWTADEAWFRVPAGAEAVALRLAATTGRAVHLFAGERKLATAVPGGTQWPELTASLADRGGAVLRLVTEGARPVRAWRRGGDYRRLGTRVVALQYRRAGGPWEALPLEEPATVPLVQRALRDARFRLPLNRRVLYGADAFIVHSRFVAERVRRFRDAPLRIIPHGAERLWREERFPGERRHWRAGLPLPPRFRDGMLLLSFGGVQPNKRFPVLAAALRSVRATGRAVYLAVAGKVDPDEVDAWGTVRRLGLEEAVTFLGYVPEALGTRLFHAADLVVQLRGPSTGGTSGAVYLALAHGRGVVASALDEQRELPEEAVRLVAPGPGEPQRLAELLCALHDRPEVRQALEAGARRYVGQVCHWSLTARQYAEALAAFPPPRGALLAAARKGYPS